MNLVNSGRLSALALQLVMADRPQLFAAAWPPVLVPVRQLAQARDVLMPSCPDAPHLPPHSLSILLLRSAASAMAGVPMAAAELPCHRCSLSCSSSSVTTKYSYGSATTSPSPSRSQDPPCACYCRGCRCRQCCPSTAQLLLSTAWPAKARRGHGWPRPSPSASPPRLRRPLPAGRALRLPCWLLLRHCLMEEEEGPRATIGEKGGG